MEKNTRDTYIPAFFADRSILITGGTGFLGKALIEKLLRSCPDIAKVYLLIRPKKGLDINERLKKMLENKVNLYLIMLINIWSAQSIFIVNSRSYNKALFKLLKP